MSEYGIPKKAVLILDIQEDFTGSNARMPVDPAQARGMIENVNWLVAESQKRGVLVVYVKNAFHRYDLIGNLFRNRAAVKKSPGGAFDGRLAVVNENVFCKSRPDAFSNRDLEMFLLDRQANELFMTGVFAERCVYSTSKSALAKGFAVTYIRDAVASRTMEAANKAAARIERAGAIIRDTKTAFV